jgi:riboflavin kinase/FMN adenylyltransferase
MDVLGGGVRLLSDIRERNAIIRLLGVEDLASVPFTAEVASLSTEAYIDMLCERWDVRELIVGYNYTCGARGAGRPETLAEIGKARGFDVSVVQPVMFEGAAISSTRIRTAVERGEMELAAAMLGRQYSLAGRVVKNRRIGSRIGFPTANIEADPTRVMPPDGVYATCAYVEGTAYRAVTNIGNNPTVNGDRRTIETHIIDFDADIYGRELTVAFRFMIRGEITFDGIGGLKEQIAKDVAIASRRRRPADGDADEAICSHIDKI